MQCHVAGVDIGHRIKQLCGEDGGLGGTSVGLYETVLGVKVGCRRRSITLSLYVVDNNITVTDFGASLCSRRRHSLPTSLLVVSSSLRACVSVRRVSGCNLKRRDFWRRHLAWWWFHLDHVCVKFVFQGQGLKFKVIGGKCSFFRLQVKAKLGRSVTARTAGWGSTVGWKADLNWKL